MARDDKDIHVQKNKSGSITVTLTVDGQVIDEWVLQPELARQFRAALEKVIVGRSTFANASGKKIGFRSGPEAVTRMHHRGHIGDDARPRGEP